MSLSRAAGLLLVIIYLGFVSLGLPDGTLGVAWPAVYPELRLPVGLAGVLMLVGTLLTATSGFSSGWVAARFRTGPVVLVSCALTSGAMLLLSQAHSAAMLFIAVIPLGLGAGAVDAGLNGYVARHYSGRHMNWLHACWGIGATAGPLVMGRALATAHGWRGGYLAIGSIQLGLAALFLATLRLWEKVPTHAAVATAAAASATPTRTAASFEGWLSAVIFALYTGAELSIGLWAGTILVVDRGFAPERAALWVAGYYGAITAGRIGIGFVHGRWTNRAIVRAGTLLAGASALGFAFGGSGLVAVVSLALIGLGFAPVYPGLMHEVPRRFAPEAVQTVIGRQSGAGALGAAVFPALSGAIAQEALSGVIVLALALMLALAVAIGWLDRRT
ncbi:MAG: MFS transporter [Candidatus Didemnitutus sp.]|nr:MFS transporter [Candidatus Didemnitutus sp.]